MAAQLTVSIVGAGSFARGMGAALRKSGFRILEIVSRNSAASRRRARLLAKKLDASASTFSSAALGASLVWLCVPDREIGNVAATIAACGRCHLKFAFHSSGALSSRELAPLRRHGIAVASVHPLMTFVPGAQPSLSGVPFALEGDARALAVARQIVRRVGGEPFLVPARRKAAYHAWATLTSPLLLAFLVTLEEAAQRAGLTRQQSRRKSLPIIRQTLANYAALGPAHSFSGPIIRGDAETVAQHLSLLRNAPEVRDVYIALAKIALRRLPSKNRTALERLLNAQQP